MSGVLEDLPSGKRRRDNKSLSSGSMPVEEAFSLNCNALIFQIPLRVCRNWHHVVFRIRQA
jgi:hypothetical protein